MQFLIKCITFVLLLAVVSGRSVRQGRNADNSSENIDEASSGNNCNCDWRYLKHYEAKGCQAAEVDSCGCPTKFACIPNNSTDEDEVCKYHGKEYTIGSKINITDDCQVCRCRGGIRAFIFCMPKECPELEVTQEQNCYPVYEKNKCCPTRYECVREEIEETERRTCEYNSVQYPLGSKINPIDDPCLTCDCTESWNGTDSSSCHQQDCMLEKNQQEMDAGCIPVYHENKCCPIEFYCPENPEMNTLSVTGKSVLDNSSAESGDYCSFDGERYVVGSELHVNNSCIKCTCQVPPDFTCIHKSCPLSLDAEICFPYYISNQCCPLYECNLADVSMDSIEYRASKGCPTPMCADESCRIEIPPGHQCPTCVCKAVVELETNDLETNQQVVVNGFDHEENAESEVSYLDGGEDTSHESLSPKKLENSKGSDAELLQLVGQEFADDMETGITENVHDDAEYMHVDAENTHDDAESIPGEAENSHDDIEDIREDSTHGDQSETSSENFDNIKVEGSKVIRKRSEKMDFAVFHTGHKSQSGAPRRLFERMTQDQISQNQHQQIDENSESEREGVNESSEDFDELQMFGRKGSENGEKSDNGITETDSKEFSTVETVPDGCPTPMCADSTCRIGIPPGHQCPVCICRGREGRQP